MNAHSVRQYIWGIGEMNRNDEKGMALIFTLGILIILMMLGLAFAMLSQTNRKLAAVNSDVTIARLLAESTLERVISSMRYYNNDLADGKIYPGTSSFFKVTSGSDAEWDHRRVIFSHETDSSEKTNDWIHRFKASFKNSAGKSLDYIGWDNTADLDNIH